MNAALFSLAREIFLLHNGGGAQQVDLALERGPLVILFIYAACQLDKAWTEIAQSLASANGIFDVP